MTLTDALLVLARKKPGLPGEGYKLVAGIIRSIVGRYRAIGTDDVEDIAGNVIRRLITKVELGDFVPTTEAVARGYIGRAASNAARSFAKPRGPRFDDYDDERLWEAADQEDGVGEEDPEVANAARRARVSATLDLLATHAEAARAPRYRADLRNSYDQLRAIRFDGASVASFLGAARADAAEVQRTEANRLYKAHERCRVALAETIERLVATGQLEAEAADFARKCVDFL